MIRASLVPTQMYGTDCHSATMFVDLVAMGVHTGIRGC